VKYKEAIYISAYYLIILPRLNVPMTSFRSISGAFPELTVETIEELVRATCGEISGTDSFDHEYRSIRELWQKELADIDESGELTWYSQAAAYWEKESNCPVSDDGVLGKSMYKYFQVDDG
jgi:hypothetical protein